MSHAAEVIIRVKASPELAVIIEALENAVAALELVPEWHAQERQEAAEKIRAGLEMLEKLMIAE